MITQPKAIIEAFLALGGVRTKQEITAWVKKTYGPRWKDFGTVLADMVPESHGGKPSSTVASKNRCLMRVSLGKYCLISKEKERTERQQEPIPCSRKLKPFKLVEKNRESHQSNIRKNFIITSKDKNTIELYSTERLPFEPKGWKLDMRNSLKEKLKNFSGENVTLHATYKSMDSDFFDVENVLFYNVGAAAFRNLQLKTLQFERVYDSPESISVDNDFLHYQGYHIIKDEYPALHWKKATPLARWKNIEIQHLKSNDKPHHIWLSMKHGKITVQNILASSHYGLEITLTVPVGFKINIISIMKPLLDGLISAFHHYEGEQLNIVAPRLAQYLHLTDAQISSLLLDQGTSILGGRSLIQPYRQGVKWNPEDDTFLFIKINYEEQNKDSNWFLSGELFSVIKK